MIDADWMKKCPPGWFKLEEASCMATVARALVTSGRRQYTEIGTWAGRSAYMMAHLLSLGWEVATVDPYIHYPDGFFNETDAAVKDTAGETPHIIATKMLDPLHDVEAARAAGCARVTRYVETSKMMAARWPLARANRPRINVLLVDLARARSGDRGRHLLAPEPGRLGGHLLPRRQPLAIRGAGPERDRARQVAVRLGSPADVRGRVAALLGQRGGEAENPGGGAVRCPIQCGRCCNWWRDVEDLRGEAILKPDGLCPYLGEKGCKLESSARPRVCMDYLCGVARAVALGWLPLEVGRECKARGLIDYIDFGEYAVVRHDHIGET